MKLLPLVLVLLMSLAVKSQQVMPDSTFQFVMEYQDLYSTHRNHFRGGSFTVVRQVSDLFQLGIGAEYAASRYHLDNDWNLYHLRLLPVWFDVQLKPRRSRRLDPVVHTSEGISYITYGKKVIANPGSIEHRREVGLYTYLGAGFTWKISRRLLLVAEAGFKGYHMSFDAYQVNPHGSCWRAGLVW